MISIESERDAEVVVLELASEWRARNNFFKGGFKRETDEFVAQVYVGPVYWDVLKFEIDFFVEEDREGKGYVTEAV